MEEAEEIADRDQDDGMKLEPFNLAQERQEGFFDESGHYVEHKPDDEDDKDAWLGSEDGEQHQPLISAHERSLALFLQQQCWLLLTLCAVEPSYLNTALCLPHTSKMKATFYVARCVALGLIAINEVSISQQVVAKTAEIPCFFWPACSGCG